MRRVALIVLLSIATAAAGDKPKARFAPGPASSFPSHQTQDKVTIAAIPYTSEEQAASAFGKVNPYKYGILPVLVVLQNDTGKALRLNLEAKFIGGQSRGLEAMPPSDVVLFNGGRKASWQVPTPRPFPLPQKNNKGPLNSPEIEGRAFNARLVPIAESVHGFFYFETSNEPDARIYLTGIKEADSGKDYFYFEVPLEK
jgi:hypothetical protein